MDEMQLPEEGKKKRSSKVWIWVVGGLVAVLLIALVVGLATDWFGLYGPLTKIALGAKNLADGKSATATFSASASGDIQIDGALQWRWDPEQRELAADLQFRLNDQDYRYGIVDKCVVFRNDRGKAKCVDISKELDQFFDAMEGESDLDESLEELLETVFKAAGIHKQIDSAEAVKCLKSGFFRWNRTDWLEDNAGYTLKKKDDIAVHCLEPKTGKLLLELVQQFEPAFNRRSDYLDVASGLRELRTQLNEDYSVSLALGLRKGTLVLLDGNVDWKGTAVSFQIRFDNIGTTKVDTASLREIKNEAKN